MARVRPLSSASIGATATAVVNNNISASEDDIKEPIGKML